MNVQSSCQSLICCRLQGCRYCWFTRETGATSDGIQCRCSHQLQTPYRPPIYDSGTFASTVILYGSGSIFAGIKRSGSKWNRCIFRQCWWHDHRYRFSFDKFASANCRLWTDFAGESPLSLVSPRMQSLILVQRKFR